MCVWFIAGFFAGILVTELSVLITFKILIKKEEEKLKEKKEND